MILRILPKVVLTPVVSVNHSAFDLPQGWAYVALSPHTPLRVNSRINLVGHREEPILTAEHTTHLLQSHIVLANSSATVATPHKGFLVFPVAHSIDLCPLGHMTPRRPTVLPQWGAPSTCRRWMVYA